MRRLLALLVGLTFVVAACGTATDEAAVGQSIELVSPQAAASVITDAPADLMVLDVRTPEEFAGGHLAGAVNVDFYAPDFQAQLEALDPSVPYVVYCRSGNRSATAVGQMEELGFQEISEIDGGIVSWAEAGLPIDF